MTPYRLTSLDPIKIPGWRWSSFLDDAINELEPLSLESYPISSEFLDKEGKFGSRSRPEKATASTWACKTNKIRQIRAACIEAGRSASVLNFVISPSHHYDLPFFGADFVTLPSGHLLALDFQPVMKADQRHTDHVWERLIPLHDYWKSFLPGGGPIPVDAQPYFSPGFLWTRLPLDSEGDKLINNVISCVFREYLHLYLDFVRSAQEVSKERSVELLSGQRRYMSYRSSKDPARGMLSRFFGHEWTELYINNVLFDL